MQKILKFFKQNSMMTVAMFAALVTVFFVPIDRRYLDYIDFKTLSCLFCVLAVVCALKDIDFFYMLARKIVEYFHTARLCVLALVYITFIGSMLIANDMALLTFLPLGFMNKTLLWNRFLLSNYFNYFSAVRVTAVPFT